MGKLRHTSCFLFSPILFNFQSIFYFFSHLISSPSLLSLRSLPFSFSFIPFFFFSPAFSLYFSLSPTNPAGVWANVVSRVKVRENPAAVAFWWILSRKKITTESNSFSYLFSRRNQCSPFHRQKVEERRYLFKSKQIAFPAALRPP